MRAELNVCDTASKLVRSRVLRISLGEQLDPAQEAQRTVYVCREMIDQGLVTDDQINQLYQSCVETNGVIAPEEHSAETFSRVIMAQLNSGKQLSHIDSMKAEAMLLPVMRLFVEYGIIMQFKQNLLIIDRRTTFRPARIEEINKVLHRIDLKAWQKYCLLNGRTALSKTMNLIEKVLGAAHRSSSRSVIPSNDEL